MSGVRLFGKLPAHGDFVARGLAAAERDALDEWLSQEMTVARERLAAAFEDRYDRAPPWRFMLTEGAGVLVASVDAVGRRFPLWVAIDRGGEAAAEQAEALVYRAFGESWDADRLVNEAAALAGTMAATPDEAAVAERWWTQGGDGFAPASLNGARPVGLMTTMLMFEVNA